MNDDWKERLSCAARSAKAKVIGLHLIEEAWHGLLAAVALEAFGDDPRATFFIEGMAPRAGIPRPDLIIIHPALGVLVIENKGISLDDIQSVIGTSLWIARDGALKEEDPFRQAGKVAMRLRDLCRRRVGLGEVVFWDTAALPRIGREEFERRFATPWPEDTIFAETLLSPESLRRHLLHCAAQTQRKTGGKSLLTARAHDAVMSVLSGKHALSTPRRTHIVETDQSLIGVQVQELELSLKEPTQQQKELGRADLSGGHWLFRGVAGSGKSVMLALNAAQTLARFVEERASLFGKTATRRLLVVCFNRTLVHYLRQRIEERFGRLAWDKPASSALTVIHFEGLVRRLEKQVPALATGLDFRRKSERARKMAELLGVLDERTRHGVLYDAVYVDEAQDLDGDELRLLLALARPNERGDQTLVIFYDNAQNLYGMPAPVWSKLGIRIVGRTVFLDTCLRNTRQTLELAFNVLTGSFAAQSQRVGTRRFADVESLRERGLVEELDGRFEIHYAKREGPWPFVKPHAGREGEITWLCEAVRRLLRLHKVAPSDILILYNSPTPFEDVLQRRLQRAVGRGCVVRLVDRLHNENKNRPLLEEGVLTVSTIASAKGYDAPIVFLIGVDQLEDEVKDRATFYVGATRAKLRLIITGVKRAAPTLLDEVLACSRELSEPQQPALAAPAPKELPAKLCRHCGSSRLHAQGEGTDAVFVCIDCTRTTPMELACPRCGQQAATRRVAREYHRACGACGHSDLYHVNVPLEELFQ